MNAKFLSSVLSVFVLLVSATFASAQNVLLFTFDDSGPNVTATVTGSFDTSGLSSAGQASPTAPSAFDGFATFTMFSFGTTNATSVDLFSDAIAPGPINFFPFLSDFPARAQGGTIVTPLSEYLELTVQRFNNVNFPNTTIGLAEGETVFDADALTNNVLVFNQSALDDLGDASFLSTTPTTVLSDPSGGNIIQFVLAVPEIILGDVNRDGVVNFSDIPSFIESLAFAAIFVVEADVNQDGSVDFGDIPRFIEILQAQ